MIYLNGRLLRHGLFDEIWKAEVLMRNTFLFVLYLQAEPEEAAQLIFWTAVCRIQTHTGMSCCGGCAACVRNRSCIYDIRSRNGRRLSFHSWRKDCISQTG